MPHLSGYRTYANSVIVEDMVFMPSYGIQKDAEAKAVYERFGYKVFLVNSETISTAGNGSVHCATMAYPEINLDRLLRALNAELRH